MCTQRFYFLIFIWFLIHLFSITPIQCKSHRRNLVQHYVHQNNQISYIYPVNLIPIREKRPRPFKLQKVDSLKPSLDSTSDSYPTSTVKLNSSFKIQSTKSVTHSINSDLPQHLRNYSITVFNENNNIQETMKISSDLKTSTENCVHLESITDIQVNQFTKVESSILITDLSSTTIRVNTVFSELEENPKILRKFKGSTKNDLLTKNSFSESKRKTLLDLEGPNILEDLESSIDQSNSIHIRVKRDNPNKDNIVPSFKSSYLKDLAASFPKNEQELEEERLALNKVEDERLIKRSSDAENEDNLNDARDIKLSQYYKRRNEEFDTSNENSENQQKSRFDENSRLQQKNLYSDLEDEALVVEKKRNSNAKGYPESYLMEDEAAPSVFQITKDYQTEHFGKHGSYEYVNDQEALQNSYPKDNKFIDSMLSKMDYEALNGNYLEKMNQQNIQNDDSKNQQNNISDNLYSSGGLQPEQPNLKSNSKSVEGEFVDFEEVKDHDAALKEASMQFPEKEVRFNAIIRNRRRTKAHNKRNFKKNKNKKSRKFNKRHKKKKGRKNRKILKKYSKMQESLAQLDKASKDKFFTEKKKILNESTALVQKQIEDNGQVEFKIDKRDSSEGRSEVNIIRRDISNEIQLDASEKLRSSNMSPKDENNVEENEELILAERSKRDAQNLQKSSISVKDVNKSLKKIQKSVNLKERVRRNKNKNKQCIQPVDHEKRKSKYYEKVHEPETLNQKDVSKFNVELEHTATKGAMKSVEEIKTFVDKLVEKLKVNDLHNFVGINGNKRGKKETRIESNSKLMQIPKIIKRCMLLEKHGNTTSKVSKCKLGTEIQVLRDSRDQKQKKMLKRKKETDSNQLVQLRPKETRKQTRGRRKRKSHRKWDTWTDWSSCSVTCGKGRQIRWRHCIQDCRIAETEMEEKTCQLPACPPGKFLGIF